MVEYFEIPPPRPKRKPTHPYPRKLALNAVKESQTKQRARSTSPHSSLSEQDNRSPTSVLSAVISDTLESGDATTPNSSPPRISSDMRDQAEDDLTQDEGHLSQSIADPVSVKLELFSNICMSDKEDCASGKVLKLFGTNVVITSNPSNSSTCKSKSPFSDIGERMVETWTENRLVDIEMTNFDSPHKHFDSIQVDKPIPLPWWVLYRGTNNRPFGEALEKETQVDESCGGSNGESVNGGVNTDVNLDVEAQSGRCASQLDKDKPNPWSLERKTRSHKIGKGFVPYKRCFSDRDVLSSTITSDDREGQRIRLCL